MTEEEEFEFRLRLEQEQEQAAQQAQTQPGAQPMENVTTYAAQAALPAAIGGAEYVASPALRELQAGLINAGVAEGPMPNMTQTIKPGAVPGAVSEMGKRLYSLKDLSLSGALKDIGSRGLTQSVTDLARFVTEPLGGRATIGQMATGVPKALAAGAMAPENLLTLPYNMAAYEQAKIRENPTAPGLEYNPYAQVVRGEAPQRPVGAPSFMGGTQMAPTQGAAAAANRRRAIASQQYGGLTAEEQDMLRKDRELSYAMRLKAAKKVLGQP